MKIDIKSNIKIKKKAILDTNLYKLEYQSFFDF